MAQTFFINPATGNDNAAGSQSAPFKTITKALQQAQTDTTIQLAAGNYNAASGEVFPLKVPTGVKIVGNEANKGSGILIEGSGSYSSPNSSGGQNVTVNLANNAQLRGVTATNLATRGTAVWIESNGSTVANCTFTNSKREGIFVTGDGNPVVTTNVFTKNLGNGISLAGNAKGEIRGNTCQNTGYGMSIADSASPLVVDNQISGNRSGIVISGNARPKLRNNLSERNSDDGVTVIGNALPDLGSATDAGKNILRYNTKFDLQNSSSNQLIVAGNQMNPDKVKGSVNLLDNQLPPTDTAGGGGGTGGGGTGGGGSGGGSTVVELTDIKGHWAETFIQELVKQEIISGFPDKTFRPDASLTRSQYAALLTKAFNPPAKREAIAFKDVANSFWGYAAIQQAYRGEFLSGFPDKTFKPNDNVQRVQVIVSLVNGLKLTGGALTALNFFDDRTGIPDYAKDEVATAAQKQLVVNHPTLKKLNPTRDATRAEVAAIIYQALVNANRVSAINSPYIVTA
ncbi:DUF1565 domain-containing protein [Coleofasciculus sp. FACHB-1120]|uniref:DUF1565 domain-containing protein n=1 Tax=Coleofasciculus sp. FACHB-1120 TaxID=2692783 RepID=UPI001689FB8A|nr:DUF1565 domain-containing protein [Coleofasciculus sp. FACHB-1120]MBD2743373.1 DUF1565 domain-containing protein [Coleofasciculus sp. FACHB-1120]